MEHGGWGFLLEPIVLALALAPGVRGSALAIAAIAAFLVRQPLKVWWSGLVADHSSPRTGVAAGVALAYSVFVVAGGLLAFFGSVGAALPLLIASPLVLAIAVYDVRGRSRELLPELAGPVALASVAAGILMLAGWSLPASAAVWGLVSLRAVPSVVYVRARLRLEQGREPNVWVPLLLHAAALAAVLWIVRLELAPSAVAPLYALLMLRCWAGLSSLRRRIRAKSVGFSEVRWGLISVAWLALAFRLA